MEIFFASKVKILHYNRIFNETVKIYQHGVRFYTGVCEKEWENIKDLSDYKRLSYIESVSVASSKRKEVEYDFSQEFPKFPVYMRRAVINAAIGCYSSHKSHYDNWERSDKKGSPPKLVYDRNLMPILYRYNCYVRTSRTTAKLKIYHMKKWQWLEVQLCEEDVRYIETYRAEYKELVPTLKKYGKQWFLVFPFKKNVEFKEIPILERKICAVDLGLNHNAVCSIMLSSGEILAREFIDLADEKDKLQKAFGRLKKAQKAGAEKTPVKWNHINNINTLISKKTARGVLDFALRYNADVIVFEHLDFKGKKIKGKKKENRHLWRRNEIQGIIEHYAHRNGIRYSRVCPWGTSQLAFDGSGSVVRYRNRKICKFSTGKVYNCDLSASYNIGAR